MSSPSELPLAATVGGGEAASAFGLSSDLSDESSVPESLETATGQGGEL